MTREPETEDGTATPAARGLPDHLDVLAEPLRTPARERGEAPGSVPPSGTAAARRGHEPSTGTGPTPAAAPTPDLGDAEVPGTTNGVQTGIVSPRGDADTARPDDGTATAPAGGTPGHEAPTGGAPGTSGELVPTGEAAAVGPPGAGAPTDPAPRIGDPTGAAGDRPARPVDLARRQGPTASVPAPRPDPHATRALPAVGLGPEPWPSTRPETPQPAHHAGGSHAGARPGAWTPPPHVAPGAPSARHRRQPWAVIVLSTLFALTLALATYLVVLTRAHEQRAAEWEQVARTTGTELAQQRVELDGAIAELEAVRTQLQTAQARITELADEKAQIGDEREAQRQLVDYQARVSEAAGKVAGALDVCVDGQYQLISYLENAAAYDAADLARFRTDVQQVCGAARDANAALQLELER